MFSQINDEAIRQKAVRVSYIQRLRRDEVKNNIIFNLHHVYILFLSNKDFLRNLYIFLPFPILFFVGALVEVALNYWVKMLLAVVAYLVLFVVYKYTILYWWI